MRDLKERRAARSDAACSILAAAARRYEDVFERTEGAGGDDGVGREPEGRISNMAHLPMVSGISPESLLFERSSSLTFIKLPTSDGNESFSKLCDKSRKFVSDERIVSYIQHSETGAVGQCCNEAPITRLPGFESIDSQFEPRETLQGSKARRPSAFREERFVRVGGMVPVRLVNWIASVFKERRLPKDGGMAPDNLEQLPSEDGIVPRREFTLRSRYRNRRRLPNSSGMYPSSLLSDRSILRRN
ncbi:hypothetical protein ACMD2_23031, partial [Ananas comosus]